MTISKLFAKKRGFTLVELMIVVVIIGVLASLAIYGVAKYVRNAKTAEARNGVGAISKGAIARYNAERMAGSVLAIGGTVGSSKRLCLSTPSNASVPASMASIKGQKWQSGESHWDDDATSQGGFSCVRFSMTGPQYYAYNYLADTSGTTNYSALAYGDLDGDSTTSSFTLLGQISSGTLAVSPAIIESNPEE